MNSKLEEFRQRAADCRQMAVAATSEFAKQHWLAMTMHWMKLAAAEEATTEQIAMAPGIGTKVPTPGAPAPRDLRVVNTKSPARAGHSGPYR
jgi:hypothetical protein